MAEGVYDLGGQAITLRGNRATLPDGTIAGSATNLYECMRLAVSFGITREEAVTAATLRPAEELGAADRLRHVVGREGHRFYAADGWKAFAECTGWPLPEG